MDIKLLRNFVEIVDSGSLTAASKKLFIAQPALSNQLKALEKEMGTLLIERNSRHQKLTDAGRLFYDRAKSIILMENSLVKEMYDVEAGTIGELKLAVIQSSEMALLREVIPLFISRYPAVRFEIHEKESDVILSMLEDGAADIGIVRTPCALTTEMDVSYLSDERLVCVYRADRFSPAPGKTSLEPADLEDLPILIIRRYEEMFTNWCGEAGVIPTFRCRNKLLHICQQWAEKGLGVAIMPSGFLADGEGGLTVRELAGDLVTKRAIVTMKNCYHSRAMDNFLALCREKL
ncbi:MAG: LysR family transcriptional regulator [Clostridia bacterium]|nr:LysR family transcriptional regulator [Clostridia bacterium]